MQLCVLETVLQRRYRRCSSFLHQSRLHPVPLRCLKGQGLHLAQVPGPWLITQSIHEAACILLRDVSICRGGLHTVEQLPHGSLAVEKEAEPHSLTQP